MYNVVFYSTLQLSAVLDRYKFCFDVFVNTLGAATKQYLLVVSVQCRAGQCSSVAKLNRLARSVRANGNIPESTKIFFSFFIHKDNIFWLFKKKMYCFSWRKPLRNAIAVNSHLPSHSLFVCMVVLPSVFKNKGKINYFWKQTKKV